MASRLELQSKLEELLGSRNVYYDPPESIKMAYPAIVYVKSRIESRFANNAGYSFRTRYDITVIDKKPDNTIVGELLKLPYCSYDRCYSSDNLHHDVLNLYY